MIRPLGPRHADVRVRIDPSWREWFSLHWTDGDFLCVNEEFCDLPDGSEVAAHWNTFVLPWEEANESAVCAWNDNESNQDGEEVACNAPR